MKDYASQQRNPGKHMLGLGLVVLLHILVFWAISSGLAKKFVKVIKGPVEAQLIEDAKPDIPPPPPPPPPKSAPPPPAYVPPVDVPTTATAGVNAIASVSATPAPPAPVVPPAPAVAVRTAPIINAAANCQKPEYPSASRRNEEEGTVQLRFLIGPEGNVLESQVEKSSGFTRLDEAARSALSRCQFKPGTINGKPEQSWASMKYTWRLE
ncbi:energy transducer TonB [Limnohabitans sp. TS-CS-82]|uniref:energy transducer TonB n=1 Tax=Limnohabitans sp. TS-CS-82 TaxID=2094193 RepID=UPI000CF1CFF7|nr:energy transducer TonB [Limnohabitans sp. TS-CS-82]PQA82893.1 energy transducer TonB [Limnohabitans sp. TS-CS-82]